MKKLVLALAIGLTLIGAAVYVTYVTSAPAIASDCNGAGCA